MHREIPALLSRGGKPSPVTSSLNCTVKVLAPSRLSNTPSPILGRTLSPSILRVPHHQSRILSRNLFAAAAAHRRTWSRSGCPRRRFLPRRLKYARQLHLLIRLVPRKIHHDRVLERHLTLSMTLSLLTGFEGGGDLESFTVVGAIDAGASLMAMRAMAERVPND